MRTNGWQRTSGVHVEMNGLKETDESKVHTLLGAWSGIPLENEIESCTVTHNEIESIDGVDNGMAWIKS